MLVYRYTTMARLWQIISKKRLFLKASRPCEFNDSFECTGCFTGEHQSSFIDDLATRFAIKYQEHEYKAIAASVLMDSIFTNGHYFDGLARIVSFCDATALSDYDDLLMWAHYGDQARGVRLAIEIDESNFKLRNVKYETRRPVLDCSMARHYSFDDEEFGRFMFECLTTKCKSWQYEHEMRLILPLEDDRLKCAAVQDEHRPLHERDFLLELPGNCLKEVALGVRNEDVGKAQSEMERVRAMGFEHVAFRLCRVDSTVEEYKYRYDDLYLEGLYKHPDE